MKKNMPIAVIEALSPILMEARGLFTIFQAPEDMLRLLDCDEKSDFFFTIVKQLEDRRFEIKYLPSSDEDMNSIHLYTDLTDITALLTKWLERIRRYHEVNISFDS